MSKWEAKICNISVCSDPELIMIVIQNTKNKKMVLSWNVEDNCEIQCIECPGKFEIIRDGFGKQYILEDPKTIRRTDIKMRTNAYNC